MKRICLLTFFLLSFTNIYAQITLKGVIKERASGTPIINATIQFAKLGGGQIFSSAVTDSLGRYQLTISKKAQESGGVLFVRHLSYEDLIIKVSSLKGVNEDAINPVNLVLKQKEYTLDEVEITAKPQVLHQVEKVDRTTYIPQSELNQFEVSDLYAYIPTLNNQPNSLPTILGKSKTLIYINDRPSKLRGDGLNDFINSMPINAIQSIEVIKNPGVRYGVTDAGIININIDRSKLNNYQLSLSNDLISYGGYNNNNRQSANIYYSNQKLALYASAGRSDQRSKLTTDRRIYFKIKGDSILLHSQQNTSDQSYYANLSGEYQLSKRQIIGGGLNFNQSLNDQQNQSPETYYFGGNTLADSSSFTHTDGHRNNYNVSVNGYYEYQLDDKGSKLSLDVDYFNAHGFRKANNQFYAHQKASELPYKYFKQSTLQLTQNTSARLMLDEKLSDKVGFQAGAYGHYSRIDDDNAYSNIYKNLSQRDSAKSNEFLFKEIIFSPFVSFDFVLNSKMMLTLGSTFDFTKTVGNQLTTKQRNERQYWNINPLLQLKYIPSQEHVFDFFARKAMIRPTYKDFNPFKMYLSPSYYQVGNVDVLPQIGYQSQFSYTFAQCLTVQSQAVYLPQDFNNFDVVDEHDKNVIKNTPVNYGTRWGTTIEAYLTLPIGRYFTKLGGGYAWSGANGTAKGIQLQTKQGNREFMWNNSYRFGSQSKGWKVDLDALWDDAQLDVANITSPTLTVNSSISKQWHHLRAALSYNFIYYGKNGLNNRVVFDSDQMKTITLTRQQNYAIDFKLSYVFTHNKPKKITQRSTGSDMETRSVN